MSQERQSERENDIRREAELAESRGVKEKEKERERVGGHKVRGGLIFSVSHPLRKHCEFPQGQLSVNAT